MNMLRTIGVAFFSAALAVPALSQEYQWTFQSSNNAGDANYTLKQQWAKTVGEMSNGRISIEFVPVGSVVQYNETLEAVGSGILQGHITDSSYFAGRDPAFALLGNFVGAWSGPNDLYEFLEFGGGKELYNELLNPYGLQFLGAGTTGLEAFVSKKPISSVEDLKELKVRAPEGMVQDVFSAAGMSPVNLPFSELFTALDKGVIDAADATNFSVNQSTGLNTVAPNPVYPGFHSIPTLEISMNKAIYDELPADLKSILAVSTREFAFQFAGQLEMADHDAAREAAQNADVTINVMPESERIKFRQIARSVWDNYSDRSEMSAKVHAAVIAFLERTGKL